MATNSGVPPHHRRNAQPQPSQSGHRGNPIDLTSYDQPNYQPYQAHQAQHQYQTQVMSNGPRMAYPGYQQYFGMFFAGDDSFQAVHTGLAQQHVAQPTGYDPRLTAHFGNAQVAPTALAPAYFGYPYMSQGPSSPALNLQHQRSVAPQHGASEAHVFLPPQGLAQQHAAQCEGMTPVHNQLVNRSDVEQHEARQAPAERHFRSQLASLPGAQPSPQRAPTKRKGGGSSVTRARKAQKTCPSGATLSAGASKPGPRLHHDDTSRQLNRHTLASSMKGSEHEYYAFFDATEWEDSNDFFFNGPFLDGELPVANASMEETALVPPKSTHNSAPAVAPTADKFPISGPPGPAADTPREARLEDSCDASLPSLSTPRERVDIPNKQPLRPDQETLVMCMMDFQGPGIGRAPRYMVDDFEQLVRESDEITKGQLENWEVMRLEKARIEAEGKL